MRVLLRWLFWLIGLLLLGISGGLFVARPNPPHHWLMFQSDERTYRLHADSGNLQQITSSPIADTFEAWSPAGEWMIVRRGDGSTQENLYRMRPDGSELGPITRGLRSVWFQTWSPDGEWIIVRSAHAGSWNLYRMRVTGGPMQQLTHSLGSSSFVTLSPDAEWLAYHTNSTFIELNRMRPDGRHIQNVTNRRHFSFESWSPDGEWMIFQSTGEARNAGVDLYRIRLDGDSAQNLTQTPEDHDRFVSWSPDGAWIIFINSTSAGEERLQRMRINGSQQQHLTEAADSITFEAWSPDGQWLLYTQTMRGHSNLFRVRLDGADEQRLTLLEGSNVFQDYSPDGAWIIFTSRGAAGVDFFRMAATGGAATSLTNDGSPKSYHGFSPDGAWIIYGEDDLYRARLDGSTVQRLTNTPGEDHFIGWQPVIDVGWREWLTVLAGGFLLMCGAVRGHDRRAIG